MQKSGVATAACKKATEMSPVRTVQPVSLRLSVNRKVGVDA